jgi:hypothetical protein
MILGEGAIRELDLSQLRQRPELSGQNAADARRER